RVHIIGTGRGQQRCVTPSLANGIAIGIDVVTVSVVVLLRSPDDSGISAAVHGNLNDRSNPDRRYIRPRHIRHDLNRPPTIVDSVATCKDMTDIRVDRIASSPYGNRTTVGGNSNPRRVHQLISVKAAFEPVATIELHLSAPTGT